MTPFERFVMEGFRCWPMKLRKAEIEKWRAADRKREEEEDDERINSKRTPTPSHDSESL